MAGARVKRAASLKSMLAFGSVSLVLYGAVFCFADPLTSLFARGGAYCVLPVLTVLVVSYFYAGFAGGFWEALGVRAARASAAFTPLPAHRSVHRSAQSLRRGGETSPWRI